MRKQFLVAQTIIAVALSAAAGGVSSPSTCTSTSKVIATAPLQVYLPDGMTQQDVGEASLVSRKTICENGEYEMIDIQLQLQDEIKPYGLKIKDTIVGFETYASIDFRLKQLVNSSETFSNSTYGTTKINHFGKLQMLNVLVQHPPILFWMNAQSQIADLITATSNGQTASDRPLACSLEKAFVRLTKKANGSDGLQKDLNLDAIFRGPLQLCP